MIVQQYRGKAEHKESCILGSIKKILGAKVRGTDIFPLH